MSQSDSWQKIFNDYDILKHDFESKPFVLTAQQIKTSCQQFKTTAEKEVRILCKQDTRELRPTIFKENGFFLLPVKNGLYNIVKGEGYVDVPEIKSETQVYQSKLVFDLDTSVVGDSEMQHLDYAYAASLLRTFVDDASLLLTIRGRKYTPTFEFMVGKQRIKVEGVQTEVDGGYEGENKVVLCEAKSSGQKNTIIRQLYYPYRQWQLYTKKQVIPLFFSKSKKESTYSIWQFEFTNPDDYNSIKLVTSARFSIVPSKHQ